MFRRGAEHLFVVEGENSDEGFGMEEVKVDGKSILSFYYYVRVTNFRYNSVNNGSSFSTSVKIGKSGGEAVH